MRAMVSVCMTVKNGERFLQKQIESILPQLNTEDELICSDDYSTDSSIDIIKSFQDSRIKIIQPNSSNNHIKNFEHALKHSRGEYIFLSDHDDIWVSNKIEIVSDLLKLWDLVLTDCSLIDENDQEIAPSLFDLQRTKTGLAKNYFKNTYTGCCMAFRKDVLTKALPFPASTKAHDQWIGLIAEKYFNVCLLPKQLVRYRRHSNNLSRTGEKSNLSWLDQLGYRINLLKNLSLR